MHCPMRFIPLMFTACPWAALQAQVILQYDQYNPEGVTTAVSILVNTGDLDLITDGMDQTWDLSATTLLPAGSMAVAPAQGSPYADLFPEANCVWALSSALLGTDYGYFTVDTAEVNTLALRIPSEPNIYSPPAKILQFPFSYGDVFTDYYSDNNGPNTIHWTYSGSGTIILPSGTFTNVVKMTSDQSDMILWNTQPLSPILYWNNLDPTLVFSPTGTVGVGGRNVDAPYVWPNPCRDLLTVPNAAPGSDWNITDLQGRVILSGTMPETRSLKLADLTPGAHVLQIVRNGERSAVQFLKY